MNSSALEPVGWKSARWGLFTAIIFGVQVLLIYLLSGRATAVRVKPPESKTSIELLTQSADAARFSENFLASDPTLFAMANANGFSGEAWLKMPTRNYDISERIETPFWLSLNAERLGNGIEDFLNSSEIRPVHLAQNTASKIFASSPLLDFVSNGRTNSQLRVEGDVASRELLAFPNLQSWATNEILSNTVAQIAVNQSGTVVAVRLLARSGLPEADQAALSLAHELQFAPAAQNEPTWGKVIFDWQTIPVAPTGSTNEPLQRK